MDEGHRPRAPRHQRIRELLDSGTVSEATTLADAAVRADPEDAEARFLLGVARFKAGSFPAAEELFAAVAGSTTDYQAAYYLGLTQERQGRIADARNAYGLALARNPGFAQARQKIEQLAAMPAAPATASARHVSPPPPAEATKVREVPAAAPGSAGSQARARPHGRGVGIASRVRQRGEPYGRTVLTFRLTPDDGPPIAVEMRGRLFGTIEEGDLVEVPGRPQGGSLRPSRVRNLTTGQTIEMKGSTGASGCIPVILVAVFVAVLVLVVGIATGQIYF